jgi:hypothetical protein
MLQSIQNAFWPTAPKPSPKLFGRLGRVLHWTTLALGAVVAGTTNEGSAALAVLIFLPFALIGRAIRYILSAE